MVADEIARAISPGTLVQRAPRKRFSTKQATPACARHELRQEVSEPIGLGRSSPRERSRWEVPSRGKLTSARPLARDVSAGRGLDVYVEIRSHPQVATAERSQRDEWQRSRATVSEVVRGSGGPWSCSRVVSIAEVDRRRVALHGSGDEEFPDTRMGLAPPRESVGEVKERRKPGRRRQSRETGGGFPPIGRVARAPRLGSSCRGKTLWAVDAVLFDVGPVEAILVLRDDPGLGPDDRAGSDRERQRSNASPECPADNAEPGWSPPRGDPCPRPPDGGIVRVSTEAGDAPSSAHPAGAGLPRGGPASHGRTRSRSGKHPAVSAAFSFTGDPGAPGSRAIHGCSYRESIAEVGEKHLLRAAEGSREANRDRTE